MHINTDERRIGLSIKRLEMDDEQSIIEEYVSSMKAAPASLGEILKENLQEKLNSQARKNEAAAQSAEANRESEASVAEATAEAIETPTPAGMEASEAQNSDGGTVDEQGDVREDKSE
jgi:small subunit ribosomal protein S1